MKNKDIKLIVSDIDGTLIDDNQRLPEDFSKLMAKLEERDIIFVAASGRGIASIERKLNYKSDNLYLISDNGGILKHQDEIHFQNSFTDKELNEIINVIRDCKETTISASMANSSRVELYPKHDPKFLEEFNAKYEVVDDITDSDSEFVKISLRSDFHTTENYNKPSLQALKKKFHLVRTAPEFINIMKMDTNKGNALEYLLELLNIDKEKTIGFGDFLNDIHMLEVVGKSYVMCDGHEDVIAMADEVISSNNHNSVIETIVDLLDIEL